MPVVIPPEAFDFWLDCRNVDADTAVALLVPAPEDLFEAYEISPRGQPRGERLIRVCSSRCARTRRAATVGGAAAAAPAGAPPKRARKPKKDDRQSSLF